MSILKDFKNAVAKDRGHSGIRVKDILNIDNKETINFAVDDDEFRITVDGRNLINNRYQQSLNEQIEASFPNAITTVTSDRVATSVSGDWLTGRIGSEAIFTGAITAAHTAAYDTGLNVSEIQASRGEIQNPYQSLSSRIDVLEDTYNNNRLNLNTNTDTLVSRVEFLEFELHQEVERRQTNENVLIETIGRLEARIDELSSLLLQGGNE